MHACESRGCFMISDKLQKVALQYLLLNRNIDFISKFLAILNKVEIILLLTNYLFCKL